MKSLVIIILMVLGISIYARKNERNLMTANRSVESLSKTILEPEECIIYPKETTEWQKIVPVMFII